MRSTGSPSLVPSPSLDGAVAGGIRRALPKGTARQDGDVTGAAFGARYVLLQRLAVGGMAEIFLARQRGRAGFDKEVVIKRLRSELARDQRIRDMFLTEARIGAQLNHPNVVHVYDVDEHDGLPFIAMEYIIGEQLNQLCQRGLAHGQFLPLAHAVELMRQAAAGLGYVHGARARTPGHVHTAIAPPEGEPLDIVHLDISPTNLLVTRDGFLKVIDFGIARTRGTPVELMPGKLSYMSPEQAGRASFDRPPHSVTGSAAPPDHRSDIFSLGIVLYEITVGRRLFRGSATEVIDRITSARVEPPTFARRDFSPALESIVMRALEKYPEDRYQNAYDLADDLEAFLRDQQLQTGPVRIARYLERLAAGDSGGRGPDRSHSALPSRECCAPRQSRGYRVPQAHRDPLAVDHLGFDNFAFDGRPIGRGGIREPQEETWDDVAQPDDELAAALHIGIDELRLLRTPVPRPWTPHSEEDAGVLVQPVAKKPGLALPWLLVCALSLAMIALIAYIVVR